MSKRSAGKKFGRGCLQLLVLCSIFGAWVVVEHRLRYAAREEIPVYGLPIPGVMVTGYRMRDSFGIGDAWWIDVETTKELELIFDGLKTVKIPPGQSKIFCNHDHNNVRDYDLSFQAPTSIEARRPIE